MITRKQRDSLVLKRLKSIFVAINDMVDLNLKKFSYVLSTCAIIQQKF